MTWEAVTAISTAASALVIMITAIVGVHQLRHLRRATQLDGIMRLVEELESPKVLTAIAYVRRQAPVRMQDPAYLDQLRLTSVQDETIPEYVVLRWLEKIGTLAKNGLIDPTTLYDLNMPHYLHLWIVLSVVVRRMRSDGFNAFNNAEWLYHDSERWARREWGSETVDALLERYRAAQSPPPIPTAVEESAQVSR